VTGQKRAIEALELREARMRALLDGLDDVVFRADPRGAVSFLRAAWLGMTGRSPLESLGASLFDFVHADDRDRVQARFAAVGARRESRLHLEVRFSSQGGQGYRWVELAARPVIDAAGEVSALAGTIADVTERRRMQQRLHQSDRMASVGALAAGVAHELNSPLGVVVANLDLIAQLAAGLPRSDELEAALRDARAGAERVRKVVRDLRAFSHADDEEARGPVDVRRLLETSIASVRDRVRRRARLVTELGPVPPVDANEGRLGQVFVDLLLNAAHAIPEGSAERNEVTVATKSDLAGRVLVEFRDTGGGIAPEVLDRLFEPFTSTKPISEGTGLGLAICHGVVSGLGGELTVENHPGVGAVLRVTLPAARSRTPLLIRPPSTPAIRAKARLLVVDDEPMIGNTVRRALGKEFDVLTVTSAQEADALFRKGERFDLVLSDLMMPGMTGMELYDAVLKLSADLADRMVFMTGGAFTPRARAFLDGISNARLDKPFSVAALRKLVDEQLQRVRV
jgi:PAS domain S-box-containing protein